MVAEVQGLDGAFTFSEKLLQKIWLRGDFERSLAATMDGRRVQIVHPGKWNLLGGPDFRDARLRFDGGREVTGDIEVHLRAGDWAAHRHAEDPAYDRVILHVVLFPPDDAAITKGSGGQAIPVLALLPLLHRALEEFAGEEAVETLANRPTAQLPEALCLLAPEDLAALLRKHAAARWRQKVHFARLRIQRLGWEAACHHAALEILGYRFNRAPMLRLAGARPLETWGRGDVVPENAFAAEEDTWSLQGVRPANHPRVRLRQYTEWAKARPDWPGRVGALAKEWVASARAAEPASTREVRRRERFSALRARIGDEVCGGAVGGTRLDNLICDGLLPLTAAQTSADVEWLWYHWFAGDLPPMLTDGLRQLGFFDGREQPACHGAAQGMLGWMLARESN